MCMQNECGSSPMSNGYEGDRVTSYVLDIRLTGNVGEWTQTLGHATVRKKYIW